MPPTNTQPDTDTAFSKPPLAPKHWLLRTKLHLVSLAITLAFLYVGHLNSRSRFWTQYNLPLCAACVLVVCLATAETCLLVVRFRDTHRALAAGRSLEFELQRQHQAILAQLTSSLIDSLDTTQIPADVLDKIRQLFNASIVAIWINPPHNARQFLLRGVLGANAHATDKLQAAPWLLPEFDEASRQHIVTDPARQLSPALAAFAEREQVRVAVLTPILRRGELAGLVGVFHREPLVITPPQALEMTALANIIAGVIQAEQLYRDLIQAQKAETIGSLTSGIAHDFNNVLAGILACATYVKQHSAPSDPNYRYFDAIETSAHRGAALTKQLLSYARRESPRQAVFNPNDSLEQTLQLLERSFDKSVLFQRKLSADVRLIEMDPSPFEQIALNMAVNARDAMPNGGIFTVSTSNLRLGPKTTRPAGLALPDGDYVVLGFSDTGQGMDAATQRRIFEPFFTTKRPGKGTGLGLSLVMSIVKAAAGAIRVESAPGKGTRFEVCLPATTKPLPTVHAAADIKPQRGTECILLAEDEEIIREMAVMALEAEGYKVIAAPDGAAALARYRQEWPRIALVIADMVMPQMGGAELLPRIKEINPHVRVIVSSGHSHDLDGQRMLQHGCLAYLQKPYNTNALLTIVRQVLDSGL